MKNLLQFCFIYYKIEEVTDRRVLEKGFRACLKKHSRNLHAPLCGIFCPNSVAVARYGALIRTKSPTNCDAHLAESLFQTRSRACFLCTSSTIPAKNVKTEINCDVESTPTLPLARSPRKNSSTNLPAL